jgi:hypothetical protein
MAVRTFGVVAAGLLTAVLVGASTAAEGDETLRRSASTSSTCEAPAGKRFAATWRVIDARGPGQESGTARGPFGTLTWHRAKVDFHLRPGYRVPVCLGDLFAGGEYTYMFELSGAGDHTEKFDGLDTIGYWYAIQPLLPSTGGPTHTAAGGMSALAVVLIACGAWLAHGNRPVPAGAAIRTGRLSRGRRQEGPMS